jgi:hypothetical protein
MKEKIILIVNGEETEPKRIHKRVNGTIVVEVDVEFDGYPYGT